MSRERIQWVPQVCPAPPSPWYALCLGATRADGAATPNPSVIAGTPAAPSPGSGRRDRSVRRTAARVDLAPARPAATLSRSSWTAHCASVIPRRQGRCVIQTPGPRPTRRATVPSSIAAAPIRGPTSIDVRAGPSPACGAGNRTAQPSRRSARIRPRWSVCVSGAVSDPTVRRAPWTSPKEPSHHGENSCTGRREAGHDPGWDDTNAVVPVPPCCVSPRPGSSRSGRPSVTGTAPGRPPMASGTPASSTSPTAGHYAKGNVDPGVRLVELRLDDISEFEVGQTPTPTPSPPATWSTSPP